MKCIQCFLACIQGLADFFCGGPGCKYFRLCRTRGNIKPHPWQKANCLFFLTFKNFKLWRPFLVWGLYRSSNLGESGTCTAVCQPVTYLVIHTVYFSHTYILLLFSRQVMSDSFATPLIVAGQAPLSMGFPRPE